MRRYITTLLLFITVLLFSACSKGEAFFIETSLLTVKVSSQGYIVSMKDRISSREYVPMTVSSPLMQLYDGKQYIKPTRISRKQNAIKILFENGSEALIGCEEYGHYVKMTLKELTNRIGISSVCWGPYTTKIDKYIGETVCVVRDDEFAIGMQALTINTLDGLPTLPSKYTLIDPNDGKDVPKKYKDLIGTMVEFVELRSDEDIPDCFRLWRGNAAGKTKYGSEIRLYSKDWTNGEVVNGDSTDKHPRQRTIEPMEIDYIGSSVALFGCPMDETLHFIEQIEMNERLPHPLIQGGWIKRWEKTNNAYLNYEGNNLEKAKKIADSINVSLVNVGAMFKSVERFELDHVIRKVTVNEYGEFSEQFQTVVGASPNILPMEEVVQLPTSIDMYQRVGSATLVADMTNSIRELFVDDITVFNHYESVNVIKIDNELIVFKYIMNEYPYRLIECKRGQFGTKPAIHRAGAEVHRLVVDKKGRFPSSIAKVPYDALKLSEKINKYRPGMVYLKDYTNDWPTGHGQLGASSFLYYWYNNLKEYPITFADEASNYSWHMFSFMNIGDGSAKELRSKGMNLMKENLNYYERNLLPPMLGNYKLPASVRLEEVEWLQARSAGYDAGFQLTINDSIEKNGFRKEIFAAIRNWQDAREAHVFNDKQIAILKDSKKDFHLQRVGKNEWNLFEVNLATNYTMRPQKLGLIDNFSTYFTFYNPFAYQPIQFYAELSEVTDPFASIQGLEIIITCQNSITIDLPLKAGQKIYCDGSKIFICDKYWTPIVHFTLFDNVSWKTGDNYIEVRTRCVGSTSPEISFDFKSIGNMENIKKN